LPLGNRSQQVFESAVVLGDDSCLTLYSDAYRSRRWTQAREYGADRLLAQMRSCEASLEALLADVKKFVNGCGLRDDATGILVGTRPQPKTHAN